MQSLFPFNITAPLGLLQNAFSQVYFLFYYDRSDESSRMSRRISRKAWLQRNLCTSGGVETSLSPTVLFYTEEDTILRFVEFHLHGLRYVAEYIRRRTPALRIIPWIFHGECFRNLWNLLNDRIFQLIFTILPFFYFNHYYFHLIDTKIYSVVSMRYKK